MDDVMWGNVDDSLPDHPKVLDLLEHDLEGLAALGLWTLILAWASKQADLTRPELAGRVPPAMVRRLAGEHGDKLARLLVEARGDREHGLWEENGSGWVVHEFAYWQHLEQRAAKTGQAKRAAAARWGSSAPDGTPSIYADGDADADAGAYADGDADAMPSTPHHTTPSTRGTGRGKSSPSVGANKRGSRLPTDWKPSPRLIEWADRETPTTDPRRETAKFSDYWQAVSGQRGVKADWDATWRNWMRKAAESGSSPRRPNSGDDEIPDGWR